MCLGSTRPYHTNKSWVAQTRPFHLSAHVCSQQDGCIILAPDSTAGLNGSLGTVASWFWSGTRHGRSGAFNLGLSRIDRVWSIAHADWGFLRQSTGSMSMSLSMSMYMPTQMYISIDVWSHQTINPDMNRSNPPAQPSPANIEVTPSLSMSTPYS